MINGFPIETALLTEFEKGLAERIAPYLLKKIGKAQAVTNKQMIRGIKDVWNIKLSDARLRKIINYLRIKDKVPKLIATSKGYYIAETQKELIDYIESLDQRVKAIAAVKNALEKQL